MRVILFSLALFLALPATSVEVCAPCDLNGDGGGPNIADYAVFIGAFGKKGGEPGYNSRVDFDNSGTITMADWALLLKNCPLK